MRLPWRGRSPRAGSSPNGSIPPWPISSRQGRKRQGRARSGARCSLGWSSARWRRCVAEPSSTIKPLQRYSNLSRHPRASPSASGDAWGSRRCERRCNRLQPYIARGSADIDAAHAARRYPLAPRDRPVLERACCSMQRHPPDFTGLEMHPVEGRQRPRCELDARGRGGGRRRPKIKLRDLIGRTRAEIRQIETHIEAAILAAAEREIGVIKARIREAKSKREQRLDMALIEPAITNEYSLRILLCAPDSARWT